MTDTPTDIAPRAAATNLAPPDEAVRALVVVNAQAGLGLWPGALPAIERLSAAGWHADVIQTETEGHATELARMAVEKEYHIVVGCGGDGTLNEIVQALAGSPVALGIIPTGTANVLAREFGIPLDAAGAANVLLTGRVQPMDVGRAGARAFLMMAGVGFDAEVIHDVQAAPRRPPRLLKAPLLTWRAFHRFFSHTGELMHITLDGVEERDRVLMVVIGNIRGYGGVFQIAHAASYDDAILDVVVFREVGLLGRVANLVSVILRRHERNPGITYHRVRRVHIWTPRPARVQADGDLIGETPMTFLSEPRALRVVLPTGARG